MPYLYDAHQGGTMIPNAIRSRIEDRLNSFARQRFPGRYRELGVWFRGQFCYVDVFRNPGSVPEGWSENAGETREQFRDRLAATPLHLLRLRYFGNPDRWSFAVYSYAIDDYEPAEFPEGAAAGPPELALELVLKAHLD